MRTALVMGMAAAVGIGPALAEPAAMPGALVVRQPARRPMPDLRLRNLTAVIAPASAGAADGQLRRRLIGSMVDFYPHSGSGLFISGGGQLASRASITRAVNASLTRLLYAPRASGLRASGKVAPTATVGYVEGIGRAMEVRLEGGALLGRMNPMTSSVPRSRGLFNPALSDGGTHSVNAVMRASFGMKF